MIVEDQLDRGFRDPTIGVRAIRYRVGHATGAVQRGCRHRRC